MGKRGRKPPPMTLCGVPASANARYASLTDALRGSFPDLAEAIHALQVHERDESPPDAAASTTDQDRTREQEATPNDNHE